MSIQAVIEQKLTGEFSPAHLEVSNESHMHNVPPGSESHFKVTLVAPKFESMAKVKRHQAVYGVLKEELAGEVHALALHTLTPAEWAALEAVPDSPQCLGGSKAD